MSEFKKVIEKEENKSLSHLENKIKDNKENVIKLAEFIANENIFIKDKKELYLFDGIKYNLLGEKKDKEKIVYLFFKKYSFLELKFKNAGFVNQLITSLLLEESIKTVELDNYEDCVAIKNGILDINTLKLKPYSKDIYITSMIEKIEYKKPKKWSLPSILNSCPNFSEYLFTVFENDEDTIKNVAMMMGCLFSTSINVNKFFILNGPSRAGKTLLINLIKTFFIDKQKTSLSLKQLSKESGFEREGIENSRINIIGDEDKGYLTSGEIKRITSQDNITLQRKGIKALDFKPKFKIIAATNVLPKFDDNSDGIANRLLIIDFKNIFESQINLNEIKNPAVKNHYLADKTMEKRIIENEMSEVLNFGIWGLREFNKRDYEFIYTKNFREAIEKYKKNASTLYEFLVENYKFQDDLPDDKWISVIDIKRKHNDWYQERVQLGRLPKISAGVIGTKITTIFKSESKRLYKDIINLNTGKKINQQVRCHSLVEVNGEEDLFNN